jgi:hypothetical protein
MPFEKLTNDQYCPKFLKNYISGKAQWLTLEVSANQEAEVGRITV